MTRKITAILLISIFWASFLFAESGGLNLQQEKSLILAETEDADFFREGPSDLRADDENQSEGPREKTKGFVNWGTKNKLSGAMIGGLNGLLLGATLGGTISFLTAGSIIAVFSALGIFGLIIAALIIGAFLIASVAIGVLYGIPYGVCKVGEAKREHGKNWAAYLGSIANVALWYYLRGKAKDNLRDTIDYAGVAGMFALPIFFYDLSRPKHRDEFMEETEFAEEAEEFTTPQVTASTTTIPAVTTKSTPIQELKAPPEITPAIPGNPWWINLVIGQGKLTNKAGTLNGDNSLSGEFSFYTKPKIGLIGMRVITLSNNIKVRTGSKSDYYESGNEATEVGLLYGFSGSKNNMRATLAFGISNVTGKYVNNNQTIKYTETEYWLTKGWVEVEKEKIIFDRTDFSSIGFPIALQFSYVGFNFCGIGLLGYADINSKLPFSGVGLSFQFGNYK